MAFVYINKYIRLNEAIRAGIMEVLNDAIGYNNYSRNEYTLLYDIKILMDEFPQLQPPAKLLSKYSNEEWDEEFGEISIDGMDFPGEEEWKNEYLKSLKDNIIKKITYNVQQKSVTKETGDNLIKVLKQFKVPKEIEEQSWNNV